MKLRNKKTGEIIKFSPAWIVDNGNSSMKISSLAELNEEWEDYEESKKIYFISPQATVEHWPYRACDEWVQEKEIGNYFETEEEAERAVEKLKAWKRLKDKGFRFTGHFLGTEGLNIHYECDMKYDISEDLDLLFGGEE